MDPGPALIEGSIFSEWTPPSKQPDHTRNNSGYHEPLRWKRTPSQILWQDDGFRSRCVAFDASFQAGILPVLRDSGFLVGVVMGGVSVGVSLNFVMRTSSSRGSKVSPEDRFIPPHPPQLPRIVRAAGSTHARSQSSRCTHKGYASLGCMEELMLTSGTFGTQMHYVVPLSLQ
jgi:hypothetical protein